jgi:adenosyl cobinamide kinase/adenosyl cobinamide phosphate guanylyltransferase
VGDVTFLIGGVRSGKSSLAVEIGRRHDGEVVVIATAEPFDDDLRARIARHRDERPSWPTIEAPLDLGTAVAGAPADALLIVDCVTVWVGNELHHRDTVDAGEVIAALKERSGPSVVVTNEVGLGVHPETELGRRYRDELGLVNQALAAAAATTLLMVAGKALRLNDPWPELTPKELT